MRYRAMRLHPERRAAVYICDMSVPLRLIELFHKEDLAQMREYLSQHKDLIDQPETLGRAVRHGSISVLHTLVQLGARDFVSALGYTVYGDLRESFDYLLGLLGRAPTREEYEPVLLGACETLNATMLGHYLAALKIQWDDKLGNSCLAMLLSTYSRNPVKKAACLALLERVDVRLQQTPTMALHQSNDIAIRQAVRKEPKLLNRRFQEEEIYPPELGIQSGDGLHLTPLQGSTLLHMATEFDDLKMMQTLLTLGAEPDAIAATDTNGFGGHTPLYHTVVNYNTEDQQKADLLLQHGASLDIRASINKQLRYMGDPALEKPIVIENVTPFQYGEQFPIRSWVNPFVMQRIQSQ